VTRFADDDVGYGLRVGVLERLRVDLDGPFIMRVPGRELEQWDACAAGAGPLTLDALRDAVHALAERRIDADVVCALPEEVARVRREHAVARMPYAVTQVPADSGLIFAVLGMELRTGPQWPNVRWTVFGNRVPS